MHDPLSDILTRIRNAGRAGLGIVSMPHSNMKEAIARILCREGYVGEIVVSGAVKKTLSITIKYYNKKSVVTAIKQVSRPGLRSYVNAKQIPRVLGGLGVAILSTSKGIKTGSEAKRENQGGELLCFVW